MTDAPSHTSTNYRTSHLGSAKAESYDRDYDASFLGHFWRTVELPLLLDLLHEVYPDGLESCAHLDVACGTGRILAAISELTRSSTGVDISPDMLHFAAQRAPAATIEQADIGALGMVEEVDLVTAFRFFLNAEDDLRQAALQSIWKALRPGGFLVANIHASPRSAIGIYRRARRSLGQPADNTMAHEEFADLLAGAGFVPEANRTYGFVPLSTRIPDRLMAPLCAIDQQLTAALPPRAAVASNWLVAARKPVG